MIGPKGTHNVYTNNCLYANVTNYRNCTPANDIFANPLFIDYHDDGTGDMLYPVIVGFHLGIDVG